MYSVTNAILTGRCCFFCFGVRDMKAFDNPLRNLACGSGVAELLKRVDDRLNEAQKGRALLFCRHLYLPGGAARSRRKNEGRELTRMPTLVTMRMSRPFQSGGALGGRSIFSRHDNLVASC